MRYPGRLVFKSSSFITKTFVELLSSLSGIKINPLIGVSPLVASGLTG
jgi:hypothetical protein